MLPHSLLIPLHGIGTRRDLPLPFSFVVAGAAAALVLSFVVLLFAWRRPRYLALTGVPWPRLTVLLRSPAVRVIARGLVLLVYLWAALALVAGQDLLTNPIFGFVYVWLWVGLVPLSLLLGPVWRATNPVRTLHRALCAVARIDPKEGLLPLAPGVGVWPAALGIVGFEWLELIEPDRTTLAVLRLWAALWLVFLIVFSVVFGDAWIGAADPFEVYATFVAQLSPWRMVKDQLLAVNPVAGLVTWRPPPGAVGVVAALLGGTAYDSFTNTTWWVQTVQTSDLSPLLWGTGGLFAMVALVGLSFAGAAAWLHRDRRDPSLRVTDLPRLLAGSLVPIVVGYVIAHYATLLIVEGQRTAVTWSDPLGRGWNVFGSAGMGVNAGLFNHPTAIALVQLLAIVTGHLVGIVAAHDKSLALVRPAAALPAQVPMLAVMVAYTCGGLLLLFSP